MITTLAKMGLLKMQGLLRSLGRTSEAAGRHTGGIAILAWRIAEATLCGRVS